MRLTDVARVVQGELTGRDADFSGVSTDTRSIQVGQLFVALRGEQFDGHDFVATAFENGALCALVDDKFSSCEHFPSLIKVSDTLKAYGEIASYWAQQFSSKRIAITGSCGKTTVKQMLSSILAQAGNVLATKGNLNNEIGVPLTLLGINKDHDFAVIEMGANHAGEIGYLSNLVKADVVSILNADRAHLEGFGSIEGVARAKGEIFSGAKNEAKAVLNLDEPYFSLWKALCKDSHLSVVTISLKDPGADIFLKTSTLSGDGSKISVSLFGELVEFRVPFPGEHNIKNALIAIGIASVLGLSAKQIVQGLALATPEKGRLRMLSVKGNTVIDDSYNANPLSVKAAIDVLSLYENRKVLVLGDMAELGEQSPALHEEIGAYAKEKDLDALLTCGSLSALAFEAFAGQGQAFSNQQELIKALPEWVSQKEKSVFLVKGSRSASMEKVVDALLEVGEAA